MDYNLLTNYHNFIIKENYKENKIKILIIIVTSSFDIKFRDNIKIMNVFFWTYKYGKNWYLTPSIMLYI